MASPTCSLHPETPAVFRCDGCAALLCPQCVREGHRLLFCPTCGERALPLAAEEAATVPARRRAAARTVAARYTWRDALLYPVRGAGGYAFWAVVALWAILDLLALAPVFGILRLFAGGFLLLALALLLPAFLLSIVAATAEGEDELPDWPDLGSGLFGSTLLFLAVAILCLAPMGTLLALAGCGPLAVLGGTAGLGPCLLAAGAGLVAAIALWVPAFGASGRYASPWLFFRLDLHARAVAGAPRDYLVAVGLVAAFGLAGFVVLPLVLAPVPLAGAVLGDALQLYTLFLAAHLAGVWFRRHPATMEAVYLG